MFMKRSLGQRTLSPNGSRAKKGLSDACGSSRDSTRGPITSLVMDGKALKTACHRSTSKSRTSYSIPKSSNDDVPRRIFGMNPIEPKKLDRISLSRRL